MLLIAIIGLLLGGVAVGFAAWSAILPREHTAARLEEIEAYGFAGSPAPDSRASRRPLGELAQRVGAAISARIDAGVEDKLRRELVAAAMYETSARAVLGY